MTGNAIEMQGVSKRYLLGSAVAPDNLREALAHGLGRKLRGRPSADESREVWALRDVSLAVPEGATLGIVGRNGAGKSTLLKILSRITDPTEGRSRVRGKVGSLLEVGTGFHPELTGRENIFLNGGILACARRARAPIRRDRRLLRHRAVPRHPGQTLLLRHVPAPRLRRRRAHRRRLLLVDEVLAVGDAEFQRQLPRHDGDDRQFRAVPSCSSATTSTRSPDCARRRCGWTRGRVRALGPTAEVVDAYLVDATPEAGSRLFADDPAAPVALASLRMLGATGTATGRIRQDDPVTVEVTLALREPIPGLDLAVSVETTTGTRVLDESLSDAGSGTTAVLNAAGRYTVSLTLPPLLMPGEYAVNVWIGTTYETFVWEHSAGWLRLEGGHRGRPDRLISSQGTWAVTTLERR